MSTQNRIMQSFDYEWDYSPRVTTLFGIFAIVAVIGWVVSMMLTAIHLFALPAVPADAPVEGSIEVITSQWAYIFGVPLATLGALYYISTIGLALWWFDTRHPLIIKILTPITASGVLASSYFVWLQLFPIGEICPFCMMSASATVILLGLELVILRMSDSPGLSEMAPDLRGLLAETNYAVVVLPVLLGFLTVAALFAVPLLPLPEAVPFIVF